MFLTPKYLAWIFSTCFNGERLYYRQYINRPVSRNIWYNFSQKGFVGDRISRGGVWFALAVLDGLK